MKDYQNKQTAGLDNRLKNWAVEAMEPPPGVSSFNALNLRRDGRMQRRNPQFDNEAPPVAALSKESESRRSKSPQKLKKAKDIKGNNKGEPDTPIKTT